MEEDFYFNAFKRFHERMWANDINADTKKYNMLQIEFYNGLVEGAVKPNNGIMLLCSVGRCVYLTLLSNRNQSKSKS